MGAKNTKNETMTTTLHHYAGCPSDPGRQEITLWDRPPRFPESIVLVMACWDCGSRKVVDKDTGAEYGEPDQTGPLQRSTTHGGQ
jgi:hypothetical protein